MCTRFPLKESDLLIQNVFISFLQGENSLATKKSKAKKVDVLAHVLVPKHSILTKKEVKQLLKDYNIRLVNLPRIYEDDPASNALGAKEGDVIKITRKSNKTIVDYIETYRFVVIRRES